MRDFLLDPWLVQPSLNQICREDEVRRIGPKVMDLLVCLARQEGRAVSKEQILEHVWQGAFTTDEALTTAVYELRKALDDDARCPRFIATVRGRGYRLVAEARWLEVAPPSIDAAASDSVARLEESREPADENRIPDPKRHQSRRSRLALGSVVAAVALSAFYFWPQQPAESPERRPAPVAATNEPDPTPSSPYGAAPRSICSLVVLPLQSLDPDPRTAVVAQGLSEQLANDLAQGETLVVVPGYSSVISQRSSTNLATDAVVEGSVQESGGLLWIRLQMVDAFDGRLLWGSTYQHRPDETLNLQQELSKKISREILRAIEPDGDCAPQQRANE